MAKPGSEWRRAWQGKRCAVCAQHQACHGHHIVYMQHLRRERAPLWDPRNCLPVCFNCHGQHHNSRRKISVSQLPKQAFEFADEFGFSYYFDRYYAEEHDYGRAA